MNLTPSTHRSSRHTCVVPVSGGKDSTYVLYYLTKVLGLKTIAVNYDNGFTHPQATENLRQITGKLGVELVTIHGFHQGKLLIGNLKSFLSKPTPAMIPLMCTGCRVGIIGSACKVARKHNTDRFVMGWSRLEDTPFKALLLEEDGGSVARGLVKNLVANPKYLVHGGMTIQIMDYIHSYSNIRKWESILQFLHPGIRQVAFFDYIEYNPKRIEQEVIDALGWSSPNSKNSWQFDCQIKSLQNYLYRTLLGFSASNDYLSAQIREGYITREQALKSLQQQKEKESLDLENIRALLSKIGASDLMPRLEKLENNFVILPGVAT